MSSITFLAGFFAIEIISGISGQDSITCQTRADNQQLFSESTTTVLCPNGCASGWHVFGTRIYTTDSEVCMAAIHDGRISFQGGFVRVKLLPEKHNNFISSTKNGITTQEWKHRYDSFELIDLSTTAETITTAISKGVYSSTTAVLLTTTDNVPVRRTSHEVVVTIASNTTARNLTKEVTVTSIAQENGAQTARNLVECRDSVNRTLAIVFGVLFAITLIALIALSVRHHRLSVLASSASQDTITEIPSLYADIETLEAKSEREIVVNELYEMSK